MNNSDKNYFRTWDLQKAQMAYGRRACAVPDLTPNYEWRKGEYELMRNTFVKDIDGQEIYEGDLVSLVSAKHYDNEGEMIMMKGLSWSDQFGQYRIFYNDRGSFQLDQLKSGMYESDLTVDLIYPQDSTFKVYKDLSAYNICKVIGNIHEGTKEGFF
tara:strand:- start:686 stop:1156 length:471 start_codon:yes stop_codon:yes gene_type:complete